MRAVVYRGVNDLRLETVPVPRIGSNELLVKVAVCGVCPTDIKKIQYGTVPPPRIFGHETAGVIARLGPGVSKRGWKIGDRVALHHHVPCLKCHFCRHHAFAQCETYKRTGITAGFEPAGGGDAMLVAGQGPIGLMFTRLLQLAGAQVIATDLLEPRLRLARKFGAKWTMLAQTGRAELPLRPDARQRVPTATLIHRATRGRGLDAAVIAVPSDAAVQQALQLIRCGRSEERRVGKECR